MLQKRQDGTSVSPVRDSNLEPLSLVRVRPPIRARASRPHLEGLSEAQPSRFARSSDVQALAAFFVEHFEV